MEVALMSRDVIHQNGFSGNNYHTARLPVFHSDWLANLVNLGDQMVYCVRGNMLF